MVGNTQKLVDNSYYQYLRNIEQESDDDDSSSGDDTGKKTIALVDELMRDLVIDDPTVMTSPAAYMFDSPPKGEKNKGKHNSNKKTKNKKPHLIKKRNEVRENKLITVSPLDEYKNDRNFVFDEMIDKTMQ